MRLFFACILMLLPSAAWAGPWTRDLGHAYVKVGSNFFVANEFVDLDNQVTSADFLGTTTSLYAEIGVWERLHLQLLMPHVVFRNAFPSGDGFLTAGGGDARIALQYTSPLRLLNHALRFETKLPLYDAAGPVELPRAVREQFPLRGDGQLDFTLWLSLGGSIPDLPIYVFGELGHQFRTEVFMGEGLPRSFLDTFVYAVEVGVTVYDRIIVALFSQGFLPYGADEVTRGFVDLNAKVYAPVWEGLALEGSFGFIPWAVSASRGLSFGFGVSYNL